MQQQTGGRLIAVDIEGEMKKSYLDYSMSVIVGRALPDVRDGLKPVHRRILYTLYENSITPDKPYRKCADTVGSVLGRYHPHGDSSVYDALVRLAQDFSMRYPLIDGHGNFGSIDGDPPAAYRYTEARLGRAAMPLLSDIEKETVDFSANFDDRLKEPVVLPSRFPNLLINGSTGIAVGMATNIPPHNMGEVIGAVCALIDNPDIGLDELMEYVPGPDFPTGGIIMGRSGIRAAYGTGRGRIRVRAKTDIEPMQGNRERIVVTELPYGVNKARLIMAIAELVRQKRIEQISDLRDESDRDGMRIVIELKRDANPALVLNQLFSFSQMQETFGAILLALAGGVPKVMTLKEILQHYVTFQREIIVRRTAFDLNKAKERAHILEGLKKAIDIVDLIIAEIRSTKGGQNEARTAIMERFGFDNAQASAIVAFRLGQLAGLEIKKIVDELDEQKERIEEWKQLLADEDKILQLIKQEITEIGKRFEDKRRTEIAAVSGEVDIEDLIPVEECVITLTHYGYIKRMTLDTYQTQKRGGKGIMAMSRRDEDFVTELFICSSHDYILFFTDKGRMHRLKGYEIAAASRTSRGINAVNLLSLAEGEKITSTIKVSDDDQEKFLCMVTKRGIIKRTRLNEYRNIRKSGINAVNLDDDDSLVWVRLTSGDEQLIVATRMGRALRFVEEQVRQTGRISRGVCAIRLEAGDEVVGMVRVRQGSTLLTVSKLGMGRRTPLENYPMRSRAGKGVINYKIEKHGEVAGIKSVDDCDDVILIADDGVIIRIPAGQIAVQSRYAGGVRVMRLGEESQVVALARVPEEEADDSCPADQADGQQLQSDL
jgi:DNA gyrase subunit A